MYLYLHTKAIFFNIFSEQFFCRVFLGGRRVVAASVSDPDFFFQIRIELFFILVQIKISQKSGFDLENPDPWKKRTGRKLFISYLL